MSFILDALKKSETDRQRQNGPALFEVRVAPPRNSLPLWAVGLAALLAINLVIVAWVLLRRAGAPEPPANGTAATAQSLSSPQPPQGPQSTNMTAGGYAGPAGPQPGFGPSQSSAAVPTAGAAPGGAMGQTAGMTAPGGVGQGAGAGQTAGMGQQAPVGGGPGGYPQQPGQQPASANNLSAANDASIPPDNSGERVNPDDYAPAADPAPAGPFGNHVTRSTSSGVPLYQDAALNNRLPNLHLDLHVFAASPQQRFVMINTHRLREGDSLPEGVHVDSITPEGAVLSLNGTRFLLPRE